MVIKKMPHPYLRVENFVAYVSKKSNEAMDEKKVNNETSVLRELASQHNKSCSGFHPQNTSREQVSSNPYSKSMSTDNQFQNRPRDLFSKPVQTNEYNPVPKPIPESRPNLSGNKRKGIMNDAKEPRISNPTEPDHITKISLGYSYCNLCEIPCSGYDNLKHHLKGKHHKNKLQLLEWTKRGVFPPFCDMCHVYCSNEDALKMHKDSQKHQAKVRKLEDGGEKEKHRICNFCNIWVMNEAAYQQHLRGKKHTRVCREE